LEDIGVIGNPETRRLYRDLFLSADGIENYLNGVILFDETVYEKNNTGINFVDLLKQKGILPGIKVDAGTIDLINFPGAVITQGLDGLAIRLEKYHEMGLTFAKWRAVISISETLPTFEAIQANAFLLAQYAAICQSQGIVPMVEPEVLLNGNHNIEKAEEVTTATLTELFRQLKAYRVDLKALILKTSMVVPGDQSDQEITKEDIAKSTVRCLLNSVPAEVAGVVFLSGGQTPNQATVNLDQIAKLEPLPWPITFSYARAIQHEAMEVWQGKSENVEKAREIFIKRLKLDTKADQGLL